MKLEEMKKITDAGSPQASEDEDRIWLRLTVEQAQFFFMARTAMPKLVALLELAPSKRCTCHASSCDGYMGTSHTDACKRYIAAWEELEK